MSIANLTWTKTGSTSPTWTKESAGYLLYNDPNTIYDATNVTYDGLYNQNATWTKTSSTSPVWTKNF